MGTFPTKQRTSDPRSIIKLSRRTFLLTGTAAAALAGLPGVAAAVARVRTLTNSHWGAFLAETEGDRLVGVIPFPGDPFPTPMISNFPALVHDRARVAHPAVRKGWLEQGPGATERRGAEPFVRVSWQHALDLVAGELNRVKETYGNEAIYGGSYGWTSAGRLHAADVLTGRFLGGFGGYVDDLTNYSYGAGMVLLPHIVGSNESIGGPMTAWPMIIEHSELLVMFGGAAFKNAQITWGGGGEHSTEKWFRHARARGIEMVVINPIREDETISLNAEWIAPRPNTDTALMLAIAHTLIVEGLYDADFVERYTVGFERVRAYVLGETDGTPKTPEWAAAITEVAGATIRGLARQMAAKRTLIMTSWSLQRAAHGEQAWWATVLLAALLGQIGLPGGGFSFAYTSTNGVGQPRPTMAVAGIKLGRNPVKARIPVARIADALLEPGGGFDFNGRRFTYPDVRLIYWAGGNPFHHHQDLNRLIKAWRRPETIIVHEPWWTATAKHADIVLPATTTLERNDIGGSTRDRYIFAQPRVIPPVGEARSDFEIFADLAERLGFGQDFTEGRDEMGWLRALWQETRDSAARAGVDLPTFEAFWEAGFVAMPEANADYVYLADFRADPQENALRTPSGRIELASERIAGFRYDDCPGQPTWIDPDEWLGSPLAKRYPLHLLSTHPQFRLHSQMDNAPLSRANKVAGREPVWINPVDALARGLVDGDLVRLFNDRGAALAGLVVTDRIRPGVVCMQEGGWFDPERPGTSGSLDKQGNPNLVTRDVGTSRLGQGCTAQTALVEIERFEGPPPTVTAYDPPTIVEGV